ncbi:MAG: S-methyl-5-thioribose-1-phosphate isomerase [Thermodesulfobacteriota bacterium]|nr:S-methyl-5-thioribose-1-phosphate isomerase [Thermodesulfobacteriota bacterium]
MDCNHIFFKDNSVVVLDQTRLPHEEIYIQCSDYKDVASCIKEMKVRGAPLVGIAAALGIALGAQMILAKNMGQFREKFEEICDLFSTTRPTAVNLFWAIDEMRKFTETNAHLSQDEMKKGLMRKALQILDEDLFINRQVGEIGSQFVKDGARILTHCNAGALATGGHGTALGVIRSAFYEGKNLEVFATETRPLLQGARLTAWELVKEGISVTLLVDSASGSLLKSGKVDIVIVGADRIAANGDTANKIGTYNLAVLAKQSKVPFYIAAPVSTFDLKTSDGRDIPIEERDSLEVTDMFGKRMAASEIKVFNPAFDVTPARFITAFFTEHGVIERPFKKNIRKLIQTKAKKGK